MNTGDAILSTTGDLGQNNPTLSSAFLASYVGREWDTDTT